MYTKLKVKPAKTTLKVNKSYEGESLEKKINRMVNNKEPIKDNAPLVYTDRKDGVLPEMNIRSDRFDMALDELDAKSKHYRAKREAKIVDMKSDKTEGNAGEPGSTDTSK